MHDFFDRLGAAARRAAGSVATEVSVAAEKQKLSEAYLALGKQYYQSVKRGETPDFAAQIARIDELLQRIEELKDNRNVTDVEPEIVVENAPTAEDTDFVIVEE